MQPALSRTPYLDHSSQVPNIFPVLTEISPCKNERMPFPHYRLKTVQLTYVYRLLFLFLRKLPGNAIFVLFTDTYHKRSGSCPAHSRNSEIHFPSDCAS